MGALVEWYDFAVYAYLATVMARLFFPEGDPTSALLNTLAIFAVGFVLRPVGGAVFGHYGDRFGRRNALSASIILMAAATLAIAVLPTHAQAGTLAPVLLVVARMVQGLAAGGEWGGGTAFLVEYAPEGRKGLYGSLHQFATILGFVCGIAMSTLVTTAFTRSALDSYGWRVPFLVGALGALVGLRLRLRLEDTPAFRSLARDRSVARAPLREALTQHTRTVLLVVGIVVAWTIAYYALIGMPSFTAGTLGVPLSTALTCNLVAMVAHILLLPVTGALSDRVGWRTLLLGSTLALALVAYPVYWLMARGTYASLLLGQVVFAGVLAVFSGPAPAALAELFPAQVRQSALSLGYNIATAAFGGTAPFVVSFLASQTGDDLAPAYYVIAGAVVTSTVLALVTGPRTRSTPPQGGAPRPEAAREHGDRAPARDRPGGGAGYGLPVRAQAGRMPHHKRLPERAGPQEKRDGGER
ncbi:MFS transporter [Streptomyces triticirhizae]|uniref:MFS transporter n=1 Tax=Streptomyces triticirhizae TaxID=2483353 RepID=UPI00131541B6|nr:MFS transporter [Streptomyces triticirhizae]